MFYFEIIKNCVSPKLLFCHAFLQYYWCAKAVATRLKTQLQNTIKRTKRTKTNTLYNVCYKRLCNYIQVYPAEHKSS